MSIFGSMGNSSNDSGDENIFEMRVGSMTYKIRSYENSAYVWNISNIINGYVDRILRENKKMNPQDAVALALVNAVDYSCKLKNEIINLEDAMLAQKNEREHMKERLETAESKYREVLAANDYAKKSAEHSRQSLETHKKIVADLKTSNRTLEENIEFLQNALAEEREKNNELRERLKEDKIQKSVSGRHRSYSRRAEPIMHDDEGLQLDKILISDDPEEE